jgi:uncharacterized protein (DUF58 family)
MLDIQEILKKVRAIELHTRKAVNELLAGRYHSAFKGTGMEFSDVRPYQPGDDYRAIDWNVTSRTGQVFVKQFHEERQQTIVFAVDVSASMHFGTSLRLKSEVVAEVCALLAFSATRNEDRVGLYLFTEGRELYLPPGKGREHILRLVRELLYFEPAGRGTDFPAAFSTLSKLLHRKATVFLCSDFLSPMGPGLAAMARRHDLTAVWVEDAAESKIPRTGWMELFDPETGRKGWVDTSSKTLHRRFAGARERQRAEVSQALARAGADVIRLGTDGDLLKPLLAYFQTRAHRRVA